MAVLVPPDQLPAWIPGQKTIDSTALGWQGLTLTGYHYDGQECRIPAMRDYMIVIYRGSPATMRRRAGGPWQTAPVGRGHVSLLTRAEQSTWHWDRPIDVRHIYLGHDVLADTAAQAFGRDPASLVVDDCVSADDDYLPACLQLLEGELVGQGLGQNLMVEAIRTQIAVHVLRRYARLQVLPIGIGCFDRQSRARLVDLIDASVRDGISLDDLAASVGLSAWHFSRRFKADFGLSPHAYLIRRRIDRARLLLGRRGQPLKAIAQDCGFADQSHFCRTFRRIVGVTPARFRDLA